MDKANLVKRKWYQWQGSLGVFADVANKLDVKTEWLVENGHCFEVLESEQAEVPKGIKNAVIRASMLGVPHVAVWFRFPTVHKPRAQEWQTVPGVERMGFLVVPQHMLKEVGTVSDF
jgi:hypothetical protein